MNKHLHRVVGIDLGTTYSAVAAYNGDDIDAQIINDSTVDGLESGVTPSVVWFDSEGDRVVVGYDAKRAIVRDPSNVVIEVKREMGASHTAESVTAFGVPEGVGVGDPVHVRFAGKWRRPQEISALVLMRMKQIAEVGTGSDIHDAIITVPAFFKEPQKKATKEAALLAGLYPRQLIPEPTAAAICYGLDRPEVGRHVYLVYDLGGGTFDVSIIVAEQEEIEVIATSGDPRLGGGNFDDAITRWVLDQLDSEQRLDQDFERKTKAAAEVAKRELAFHDMTEVRIPSRSDGDDRQEAIPLDRTTFESIISDSLRRSLSYVEQALLDAAKKGIHREDVDAILLVGGSTRIPMVKRVLLEYFGKGEEFVRSDANPDTLVARGAAIAAAKFAPSERFQVGSLPDATLVNLDRDDEIAITYITEHTLGVGIQDNQVDPLIPRGENIPRKATKEYVNPERATTVTCAVYQGEGKYAFDNDLIGTVLLEDIEPRPQGYHRFKVTYALDINGLLDVKVVHVQTDKEYRARFEHSTEIGKVDKLLELHEELVKTYRSGLGVPPIIQSPPDLPGDLLIPLPLDDEEFHPTVMPLADIDAVPAEFSQLVRRVRKLLSQEPTNELLEAHNAFAKALRTQVAVADLEEIADRLAEVFDDVRQR